MRREEIIVKLKVEKRKKDEMGGGVKKKEKKIGEIIRD